jgi:hypothetical protein
MFRVEWNFWRTMGNYFSAIELLAFLAYWIWWLVERGVEGVKWLFEWRRTPAATEPLPLPGRSRFMRRSYASLMPPPPLVLGKATVSCQLTVV